MAKKPNRPARPAPAAPAQPAPTPPAAEPAPIVQQPETATPGSVQPVEEPVRDDNGASQAPKTVPSPDGPVRWLRMETSLSGPHLSLAPGDKHPFSDTPAADGGPSEAQRLIDAGFGAECDPPADA